MQTLFLGLYLDNVIVVSPAVITVVDCSFSQCVGFYEGQQLQQTNRFVILTNLIRTTSKMQELVKISQLSITDSFLCLWSTIWEASPHSCWSVELSLSMVRKCVEPLCVCVSSTWCQIVFLLAMHWVNWHRHVMWRNCSSMVMFLSGLNHPIYFCAISSKLFSCYFSVIIHKRVA